MKLVVCCLVSFRSVPEILRLLCPNITWIPHFSSVINWSLRIGLGRLQQVRPIDIPWVAIIDHSISIGTKKVLVVLRVALETLSLKGCALTLQDCECIGLAVAEQVNGNSVTADLGDIFKRAGLPCAIIKDGDATLNKGVRQWIAKQHGAIIHVIYDVGHSVANALKKQYEKSADFQPMLTTCQRMGKYLQQTALAFLRPPKQRNKGRFQSIGRLSHWVIRVLSIPDIHGPAQPKSALAKLRHVQHELRPLESFARQFDSVNQTINQILSPLKKQGLNPTTYTQCMALVQTLPEGSKVKDSMQRWLQQHYTIQQQLNTDCALPVSSDIVESLFGSYKYIQSRAPQAEINHTALLIPALCGQLTSEEISKILSSTPHQALLKWEQENMAKTLCKQRRSFLQEEVVNYSQKAG